MPMKQFTGPVFYSVLVHVLVVLFTLISWPSFNKPQVVPPHMRATIIDASLFEKKAPARQEVVKPPPVKPAEPPEPKQPTPAELEAKKKAQELEAQKKAQESKKRDDQAIALKKKKEEEKKAEDKRLAEEKRKAEEKLKLEADKKAAEKRLAEQKKTEDERKAKERRLAEEKLRQDVEKRRLEKKLAEEKALASQAGQLEQQLLNQMNAESSAAAAQREQTLTEKHVDLIRRQIEESWIAPPGENRGLEVDLALQLLPSGELLSVRIAKSSANRAFDQSALNAANTVKKYSVPADSALFNRQFRNFTIRFKPQ